MPDIYKKDCIDIFDILLLNGEALINGLSTMLGSPFLFVFCFAYNLINIWIIDIINQL